MAPALAILGLASLATGVAALTVPDYVLSDQYDSSNFFDKFDFFVVGA